MQWQVIKCTSVVLTLDLMKKALDQLEHDFVVDMKQMGVHIFLHI